MESINLAHRAAARILERGKDLRENMKPSGYVEVIPSIAEIATVSHNDFNQHGTDSEPDNFSNEPRFFPINPDNVSFMI